MKSFPSKEVCKSAPECIFLIHFFNWGFPELIHFPLHKAVQWGADGRPFHFLFYTGKQSYYSLMHVSTAVQLEQRAALSVKLSSPSNPQLFLTCSLPASRTLGSYPIQTEWVERRRRRSLEEQWSQILFSTQRCEGRGGRIEGGEASRRSEVVQLNMRISGGNLLQRWRLIFTFGFMLNLLSSSFMCHTEGLSVYHEFTKHSTNSSFYLCFYAIAMSLFLYLQSEWMNEWMPRHETCNSRAVIYDLIG